MDFCLSLILGLWGDGEGLTVKSAAHDVDVGKNSDDIRKIERQRAEDNQRHKQDSSHINYRILFPFWSSAGR